MDYFGEAKCPACGGTELKELKGKVKCSSFKEHLAKLWIPVLAAVGMFAGLMISIFLDDQSSGAIIGLMLGGAVLGGILGTYIFRSAVKRSRLRRGFSSACYRCSRCKKVFDHQTPLDN